MTDLKELDRLIAIKLHILKLLSVLEATKLAPSAKRTYKYLHRIKVATAPHLYRDIGRR